MTTSTITIIVSLIAAFTSLLSLLINVSSSKRKEIREGNRKNIEPLIEELGKHIYGIIAAIALLYKDESVKNQKYWNAQVLLAQKKLRELRPKVRYPLWGLDDSIKILILLPGVAKLADKKDLYIVITLATSLRQSMDNVIRKCFKFGRTPNYIERRIIKFRVNKLYIKWKELKGTEQEELQIASKEEVVKRELDKIIATVVEVRENDFVSLDKTGNTYTINKRAKVDNKSSKLLAIGTKVSLFKREVDRDFHYSFLRQPKKDKIKNLLD